MSDGIIHGMMYIIMKSRTMQKNQSASAFRFFLFPGLTAMTRFMLGAVKGEITVYQQKTSSAVFRILEI
jgi:hypothetical protein